MNKVEPPVFRREVLVIPMKKTNESTEFCSEHEKKDEHHEEAPRYLATFPMLGMCEHHSKNGMSSGGDRSLQVHLSHQ